LATFGAARNSSGKSVHITRPQQFCRCFNYEVRACQDKD